MEHSTRIEHSTREVIQECLERKRMAIVGVSRNEKDFSRTLMHEFTKRGYEVVPVNPAATEIDGQKCYSSVSEVTPPVEWALLMTAPAVTEYAVKDCKAAGVNLIWMHRGGGQGAVNPAAVEFCKANGLEVVEGQCPLMFFPETAFFHKFHGFAKKLTGSYPK